MLMELEPFFENVELLYCVLTYSRMGRIVGLFATDIIVTEKKFSPIKDINDFIVSLIFRNKLSFTPSITFIHPSSPPPNK